VLTVSLDCLFPPCILCAQCWQYLWIVCLHPVSCVSRVDSVSRLFVFILYLVCSVLTVSLDCLFSFCVLCALCWQCLWIVCFLPVSCVPNVASVSGLFVFILYLVCPVLTVSLDCLFSSCILCAQWCQCLWIVCFHLVSCVPSVDSVSRLSNVYQWFIQLRSSTYLDYMSNIEDGLYETGIAYLSRALGFTLGFWWDLYSSSL
jgi:hypothetical protein